MSKCQPPDGTGSVSSLISIENGVFPKMSPISTMEEIGFVINQVSHNYTSVTHYQQPEVDSPPTLIPYTTKLIKMCRDEFPHTTIIQEGVYQKTHVNHYMDVGHDHISVGSMVQSNQNL